MNEPTPDAAAAPADDAAARAAADAATDAAVPRRRPRQSRDEPRPLNLVLAQWAPVAAGVVRAVAGVIAFAAALLTLPIHFATPFLAGVGLLMLVGGCVSVIRACSDEPQLRLFSRVFPLVCCGLVVVVVGVVAVYGAGALAPNMRAPNLRAAPAPPRDDGTVRFETP